MSYKSHGCSWRRYPVMETSVPWVKSSMGMGLVDNSIPMLGWCGVPCFSSLYLVGLQVNPASSQANNGVCHQQYGSVWSGHSIQSPLGSTSPGTLAWWVWSSCTCSLPSLELTQDYQLLVLQTEGEISTQVLFPMLCTLLKGGNHLRGWGNPCASHPVNESPFSLKNGCPSLCSAFNCPQFRAEVFNVPLQVQTQY